MFILYLYTELTYALTKELAAYGRSLTTEHMHVVWMK